MKYKTEPLPSQGELETLDKLLPHIKYVEKGVGGKPTIQFSGVNVQILSGSGSTRGAVNGEGNLVIGYDENPGGHAQTGSHNLILGEEQTFTSFGGILAGRKNTISAPFAAVTGGFENLASGEASWAGGGQRNRATGFNASISGGQLNEAGFIASVSGGAQNKAARGSSWVGGGKENDAAAEFASIFGGKGLTATGEFEAIP
jgi:trimeric autotransporter adhesin